MTLDSSLTNEQRALLGCGPFWGTRCDSAAAARDFDYTGQAGCQNVLFTRALFFDQVTPGSLQRGGGIDLLNMEGSALVQSWGGVEGTQPGYTATSKAAAPPESSTETSGCRRRLAITVVTAHADRIQSGDHE